MINKEIKYLFSFTKPYWRMMIFLLILITFSTAFALTTPLVVKMLLDKILPNKDYLLLIKILTLLFISYLLRFAVSIYIDSLTNKLGYSIMRAIKERLFRNLLHMPYDYFETNKPGDIVQKISHEVDKIQHFLSFSFIRFSNNLITVIFLIGMLCWLNFTLFILTASLIPISIYINHLLAKKIKVLVSESSKLEGDLFSFYYDRVRNIKLIKLYHAYSRETLLFSTKLQKILQNYRRTGLSSSFSQHSVVFVVSLAPLIVFLYGGSRVINGTMTIGALVAYIQYMNRIYAPSNDLSGLYVEYVRAKESAIRIYPIISQPYETSEENRKKLTKLDSLEIRNLSHTYGNNISALESFSFSFHKGKKYVIAGENGCGKSTLMKYLGKLYTPSSRTIILNNLHDLNDISVEEWSQHVSFISQDVSILYDDIRNNLLYGNSNSTDKEILKAISSVGLGNFITNLPKGIDTKIGDGDESVLPSGGEAQLLATARLFLTEKNIIILDEVTSSVDATKEQMLMKKIFEHNSNAIIIAISHKLSSILRFDEVIYMENGKIIESGNPLTMLEKRGGFYKLFEGQIG